VSRLAALLAGLAVTALVTGLVFRAANGSLPALTDESWLLIPLAVGLPIVGAAVARQQPRHPIAWIFIGSGLGAGLDDRFQGVWVLLAPGGPRCQR
jgi:hypothetical protein